MNIKKLDSYVIKNAHINYDKGTYNHLNESIIKPLNTLISNVSKNNKELNPKTDTCKSRHQQSKLIIPNKSLPHVPINRTTIQHNPNINNNNHSTVSTKSRTTNLHNSEEGGN